MPTRSLLSAVLMLLAAGPLSAQGTERACQTIFFQRPAGVPENLFLCDGKKSQKVELPKFNLSEPYEIAPGDLRLAFTPNEITDPKLIPADALAVAVPAAWERVILLFQSDPAAPRKMRILPLDAGAGRFRPGEMLWFNLTDMAIAGQIGKSKLLVRPHAQGVLPPPAAAAGDYDVAIDMLEKDSQAGRPVCRTTWRYEEGGRLLVFVVPEPGRRAPRIMGIPVTAEAKVGKKK